MSRFQKTYCSQCGTCLGPGNEGVSSCCDHGACRVTARGDECDCGRRCSSSQSATHLLGTTPPRGLNGFPETQPNSALYRAYLWGTRNQQRLAISGQMALSNVARELRRRGVLPKEGQ